MFCFFFTHRRMIGLIHWTVLHWTITPFHWIYVYWNLLPCRSLKATTFFQWTYSSGNLCFFFYLLSFSLFPYNGANEEMNCGNYPLHNSNRQAKNENPFELLSVDDVQLIITTSINHRWASNERNAFIINKRSFFFFFKSTWAAHNLKWNIFIVCPILTDWSDCFDSVSIF